MGENVEYTLREKSPNTEFFLVRIIHSECGKIRARKNSVFGHFSRSDNFFYEIILLKLISSLLMKYWIISLYKFLFYQDLFISLMKIFLNDQDLH